MFITRCKTMLKVTFLRYKSNTPKIISVAYFLQATADELAAQS